MAPCLWRYQTTGTLGIRCHSLWTVPPALDTCNHSRDKRQKVSTMKDNKTGPSRRILIAAATLVPVVGPSLLSSALTAKAHAEEPKPMIMFVQIADDVKLDPTALTLRLVRVAQQTLYFADRPERIAGHIKMATFLTEWTSKAGANNFGNDPPNATLSVFQQGNSQDTLAVVKISNPHVERADLIYNYNLIEGTLPTSGGASSLFIDWIGAGGSFGFDYQR